MSFPYRFIAFEGVEGSGKSTQIRLLAERLRALGHEVVATFEPGATMVGRALRQVILDTNTVCCPMADLLMFCADRAEHVDEIIRPALEAGSIVLTDRYELSTWAYQGFADALGPDVVTCINDLSTGGLHPDVTIILDLDPAVGLARNRRHGTADRIEDRGLLAFHERVREAYLAWAADHSDVSMVANASQPAEAVHAAILSALGLE